MNCKFYGLLKTDQYWRFIDYCLLIYKHQSEVYAEADQTSKMELFVEIVNS